MAVIEMPVTRPSTLTPPSGPVGLNVLASEWTKIRSLRSTYWTLFAAAGTTIGLSAIVCAVYVAQFAHLNAKARADFDPASFSLIGGVLAQLAIAVLGVLVITGEYGSGTIHTTFAAVPQRITVLAAKTAVFAAVTLVVTTAACFIAFFIGQGILSAKGIGLSIGSPGAVRVVVGTGLYLTVLGLLALGIGTLIRKTAGAITAVFGMIFVLPVVFSLLPSSMSNLQKYLPTVAGQAIINGGKSARGVSELSPWVGLGVFALYAAVALVFAGYSLVRRDA
jgi:ABC-type transport system involved in multi-copper enzyme maturation permease subunit